MTALIGLLVLLMLACGAGRVVIDALGAAPARPGRRLVVSAALGLGMLSYLVLAIGLLGMLRPAPVLVALGALAVASASGFGASWRDLRAAFRREDAPAADRRERALRMAAITALAGLSAAALIACWLPPGAHEWDSLSYHLAAPKLYIAAGRIHFLPTMHQSNFPFATQMLYTLALLLDGTMLANLLHFAFYGLCVLGLALPGLSVLGPRRGLVAALVFASAPIVLWESGIAYIDVAEAAFVLLAALSALEAAGERVVRQAALAGILMGFALAVKTLALVPAALLALVLAGRRVRASAVAAYLLCAAVVGSPFYLKTLAYTGNPVYPFYYGLFGGRNWNAELAEAYEGEHRAFGLDARLAVPGDDLGAVKKPYERPSATDRLRNLLLAPFALVSVPRLFHNYNDASPLTHLGFLFVALPPLLPLFGRASPAARWLALVALLWLTFWSLTMQYTRYLIPWLPLVAIVAAEGLARAAAARRWLLGAAAAAAALQVGIAAIVIVPRSAEALTVALSPPARTAYLTRQVNVYEAEEWIDAHAPEGAGVVLYEETRGFFLDRPYLWGNSLHSLYIPYGRFASGADMAAWFLARGYHYALVNLQFAGVIASDEDRVRLRNALATGDLLPLLLEWYSPDRRTGERWRWLLGDALRSGAATPVPGASSRGAVVLEFRTPAAGAGS
ncbi:MAG: hypothetical protein IT208_10135 [Chthonomonadales bacterium]|nr:hypothetical protein [Chthonomonadales bacterium]